MSRGSGVSVCTKAPTVVSHVPEQKPIVAPALGPNARLSRAHFG
ncbi:MAG: hypothetical protein AAGA56_02590 [Myxococcota bacterium]